MKRVISAKGTYVLDEADLEQLGDLSLTSVIADMAKSLESPRQETEPSWSELDAAVTRTDRTINEMLAGAFSTSDEPSADEALAPRNEKVEQDIGEETADLIAPELLFPELHLKR